MKNSFKRLIKEIFKFSKYNLKTKYRKEFKIVMSNVIFKKSNLIKEISINKTLF